MGEDEFRTFFEKRSFVNDRYKQRPWSLTIVNNLFRRKYTLHGRKIWGSETIRVISLDKKTISDNINYLIFLKKKIKLIVLKLKFSSVSFFLKTKRKTNVNPRWGGGGLQEETTTLIIHMKVPIFSNLYHHPS